MISFEELELAYLSKEMPWEDYECELVEMIKREKAKEEEKAIDNPIKSHKV